jgi:hypothetical protein
VIRCGLHSTVFILEVIPSSDSPPCLQPDLVLTALNLGGATSGGVWHHLILQVQATLAGQEASVDQSAPRVRNVGGAPFANRWLSVTFSNIS